MVCSPTDNVSGGIDLRQDIPGLGALRWAASIKTSFIT
jgi:hypothetical protein